MATVYLIIGAAGATILVLQLLFSFLGFDHHGADADVGGDVGVDHDGGHEDASSFFKLLSFRAIVSALTFFGWSGYTALAGQLSALISFCIATASGLFAMYIVAWIMRALNSMHAEGNVDIERAVGAYGTVYLSIPGAKQGVGKIHVNVQERTLELSAVTAEDSLSTGSPVIVVGVVDEDTVEVRPTPRMEVIE
ncbi:MAG TPA: hypothetical protein PLJ47_08075 [Candidatus Hydrogenedentes bacterium]|nr:hypothetical protein [Candidatus Hydrogenedentota bacterium]